MSLILSGTDGLSDVDGSAATPAIRGTDANTGIFFPAADTIAFAEGGAEVARFDSSGNFGLGTATPSFPSGTGLAIYNASAPRLKFTNSTTGDASTDGTQLLVSGSDFYIQQREAASVFISTNGTNAVTVDSGGGFKVLNTIGVGNATPSTSGAGITFPATQSASSDANTLDDYEEGTFTPVLTGTNGGTATYSVQVGRYRKIGSFVCVWARVDLATVGSLNGFITVDNLPFASQNATNYYSIGTVLLANTTFTGSPVSFMNPNSTNAYLLLSVSGAAVGFVSQGDLTSSTSVTICICYHTA